VGVERETGLIPFKKHLKIACILQLRMNQDNITKRRQIYHAQDWTEYDNFMTTQIRKQLHVNRIGMSALQQVCGISPSDLQ
jgi:hypothetical protein